jgi:hypothetical protein
VNEINTEDYSVSFQPEIETVTFIGSLRLNGTEEYSPLVDLLDRAVEQNVARLVLNLEALEFLNSSGINMLSKFVIKMRQKANVSIMVKGSKNIPWQGKSLKNLQRLMPSLELELQ